MAAEQRKLLEQLMGDTLSVNSRAPTLPITDPKVCKSYIVGTCPHDLFTNTKQDYGPCTQQHIESHKVEYENATVEQKEAWGFKFDYLRHMQRWVEDCNKKIDQAQKRLEKTPDEIRQTNELLKQIDDLSATITIGLEEVEVLSQEKAVGLAIPEFFKVRQAKQQKEDRERELKALSDTQGPSGHQKLQVCDVCGAYLSRLDNDRRLADHFYGKMHLGYAQMRKTYDTLRDELKGKAAPHRHYEEHGGMGPRDDNDRWGGGRRGGDYGGGGGGGYGGRGRGGGGGYGGGRRRGGW